MVMTLNPGTGNKNVVSALIPVFNSPTSGQNVFVTDDGVHGERIWVTDGTNAGTTLLATADSGSEPAGAEFVPAWIGSPIALGTYVSSQTLFVLYDQTVGQQLWVTDGTTGGTSVVQNLRTGPGIKSYATNAFPIITSGSQFLTQVFATDDGVHGQQVWSSDGTAAGTHLLLAVPSVADPTGPDHDPVIVGYGLANGTLDTQRVYFSLEDGQELVSTDGTVAGTSIVEPLVCFLAGTLIATPGGRRTDRASGCRRRRADTPRRGAPRRLDRQRAASLVTRGQRSAATPVILRKGALGDNTPYRDLRVTKAHGVHIDGVINPGRISGQQPLDPVGRSRAGGRAVPYRARNA